MHHHHQHLHNHGRHLGTQSPPLQPDIVPRNRPPYLLMSETPTLVKRETLPTTESGRRETCAPGDDSDVCEKYASSSSSTTLPIVLGAVIPIVCAIVVLIILHRRNVKKLRREDANDKHKSLDFGLDMSPAEKGTRNNHLKGVSLDIGHHPYMLPPSLHGSRESLHSLSRTILGEDDKYRHAKQYFPADNQSIISHQRGCDDAMSIAGSTRKGGLGDDMNQGLLGNAQRFSHSSPPLYNPPGEQHGQSHVKQDNQVHDAGFELHLPRSPSPVVVRGSTPINEPAPTITIDSELKVPAASLATPNSAAPEHRPDFPLRDTVPISGTPLAVQDDSNPTLTHSTSTPMPRISFPSSDAASDYGDARSSIPVVPAVNVQTAEIKNTHEESRDHPPMPPMPEETPQSSNLKLDPRRDTRRLTMGLRPLPPEDPSDNPEQRANRIRSFYKEYFDDSKGAARETYYEGPRETYYEDYAVDYPDGGYVYDPATGDFYDAVPAPFAEPVNRRAMTPPPRAPPRFQGARHKPTGSVGGFSERFHSPGPRAFSSASGRFPGPRGPRKPAIPPSVPSPLSILPSPHLLKDDSFMAAIDYAPGKSFKDQREGRPETPLGGLRPYSPTVRAHTPLVSAFDELSVIPSPHQLRKSGTYDNLDFAPPPRFRNVETASDAGSIHSNRTGISAAHLHNIRTGAYRVSRLPPETVGTKDDLMSNLRPTWDMRK